MQGTQSHMSPHGLKGPSCVTKVTVLGSPVSWGSPLEADPGAGSLGSLHSSRCPDWQSPWQPLCAREDAPPTEPRGQAGHLL